MTGCSIVLFPPSTLNSKTLNGFQPPVRVSLVPSLVSLTTQPCWSNASRRVSLLGPIPGGACVGAFLKEGGDFRRDGGGFGFEAEDGVQAFPVIEEPAGLFGGEFTSVHGAVGITDEIEKGTEGGRDVEIVIEGGGELIFRGGRDAGC